MPWKVSTLMSLKLELIEHCLSPVASISSLCKAYGISRNTAYRLIKKYHKLGPEGLVDGRTCRKKRRGQYTDATWHEIVQLREKHPTFGPRKLLQILVNNFPEEHWPSASLIKKHLKDHGLSKPRVFKRSINNERLPLRNFTAPNSGWCMDFKGYFKTADNKRCDTFTLIDGYSRYFLECIPLHPIGFLQVKTALEKAFYEYGKPESIRSDNGPPFGSSGFRGLSPLSVWLLNIGIWPEKIMPGHPGQNGRLERAHRTLQEDVLSRGKHSYHDYEEIYKEFMSVYNTIRPHEALLGATPAQIYYPSSKKYVHGERLAYSYPLEYEVIKVTSKGYIRFKDDYEYLSESLIHEYVGIGPETVQGRPLIYLGYPLGFLEQHYTRKRPSPTTSKRGKVSHL